VTLQQAQRRFGRRSWRQSQLSRAAFIATLTALLLISGLSTVGAKTRVPRGPVDPTYRSLYLGLQQLSVVPPSLQVSTSLAAIEKHFPPGTRAAPFPVPSASVPLLYLGLTLARYSCLPDYLASITYGPGARLTLYVKKRALLPGQACFLLIGPLMYQVLALPLSQFPTRLKLEVTVDRPAPLLSDRTYFRIPAN
jgi:hypothetical protein